jgi:hypothetical protein
VRVLDYNDTLYEKADFDEKTDFYDEAHLNSAGAKKMSNHLARTLRKYYTFEDKREDPEVSRQWEADYRSYRRRDTQPEEEGAAVPNETAREQGS